MKNVQLYFPNFSKTYEVCISILYLDSEFKRKLISKLQVLLWNETFYLKVVIVTLQFFKNHLILTILNSKITFDAISSEARNLLDSSTYAFRFLLDVCRLKHFAAILGFKRFLASLEITASGLFCIFYF